MGLRDPAWWLEKLYTDGIPLRGGGGSGEVTIVAPLGRQPEGDGESVTLSDEDKAVLDDIELWSQTTSNTLGDPGDAAVTGGPGTISGKMRGLVETLGSVLAILTDAWSDAFNALRTIPSPSTTANTPAIVTAAASDALAANSSRKIWSIQNLGTNPLFVRLGTGASTTVFHFILKPGTVADDGNGQYLSDEIWKGVVSYAGTSPRLVVTELT